MAILYMLGFFYGRNKKGIDSDGRVGWGDLTGVGEGKP